MSPLPPVAPPQPAHAANTSLSHLNPLPPSVFTLPQTAQLEALYTIIRDKNTSRGDFLFYSDRIIRLLVEEGLNHLPVVKRTVETPTVSPSVTLPSGCTQLNNLFRERLMTASALRGRYAVFLSFELGRLAFSLYLWATNDKNLGQQAMEAGLREVCRSVRIGKILIQRVGNSY